MTFGLLVMRGLAYHGRTNLGVLPGSAVATAILSGALVVGDSVSVTLREMVFGGPGHSTCADDA